MPRNRDHRHFGVTEIRVSPTRRRGSACPIKKVSILGIRYLVCGQCKGVDPDAMGGLFIIAPGFASHAKPLLRDANHDGLDELRLRAPLSPPSCRSSGHVLVSSSAGSRPFFVSSVADNFAGVVLVDRGGA